MAVSLSASINISISATHVNALDLGNVTDSVSRTISQAFANGAGANQANKFYHDQIDIAASGSTTLDLSGSLTDGLGQTVTIAELKALIVKNNSTGDKLTMGDATNPVGIFGADAHTIDIFPGGVFAMTWPTADGLAIAAGVSDELKFAHEGATTDAATANVYIFGS